MHWWQSPFSSPSSTSSSPSRHQQHPDDNVLSKIFPKRLRSQRRRSTKLRYRSADDKVPDRLHNRLWRSPSSGQAYSSLSSTSQSALVVPQPLPQPLPHPSLEDFLRRDAAAVSPSTSCSPPLPSPKQPPNKGQEGRERERGDVAGDLNCGGVTHASYHACHECQRHKEHANTRRSMKAPQQLNGIERNKDANLFNIPSSAPNSPFSSPARSPQRIPRDIFTSRVFKSPTAFQAWSAPEMHPSDTNLGSAFSYQMSPEGKYAFSVESSPLHSPRVSPRRCSRSPGGPTSPNAHPLPLPPGATSPTKIPSVSPIVMPIKSQWQKGKLIGRGTFGSVYAASNRETGALCAMKEVELFDDPKSKECIKQLEQEIKVLSNLQHPNIVQYYGSEVDGDRLYIYLEYVHPGSINKYIQDHCGVISESVVRSFTRHIVCGLAYLHSTKTIHRDIKCANLLVDASGVVKLADFGMSKHLAGPAANLSLKGSPYWMAPELLHSVMQKDASSDLALAVDIWSLGCTIIEMLDGKPPWSEYEGAAAMFKVLRETPPIPKTMSPEGKDFLHCCFCRNPAERPTAIMLLEHRFLNTSQLDVPTLSQGFNEMSLMDKAESLREFHNFKPEQFLQSPNIHLTRKLANSFTQGSFSPVRPTDLSAKLPT